jgi:hypothetical protein
LANPIYSLQMSQPPESHPKYSPSSPKKVGKHGRVWRFIFVLHLYAFLFLLLISSLLAGAGLMIWKIPPLKRYVHSEVARFYVNKVAPKLPFQISDVDVDAKWNNFLKGKIGKFSVTLLWDGWTMKLSGPVEISVKAIAAENGEKHYSVSYSPTVEATPPGMAAIPSFPVGISFLVERDFSHLDHLHIQSEMTDWAWDKIHLKLGDFKFSADWTEGMSKISTSAQKFDLDSLDHRFSAKGFDFALAAPLKLKPFIIGPAVELTARAEDGKTFWRGNEIKLPLNRFPLHVKATLETDQKTADLVFGDEAKPDFSLWARVSENQGVAKELSARWKTQEISLKTLLSSFLAAIPDDVRDRLFLTYFKKLSGQIKTSGSAKIPLPFKFADFSKPSQFMKNNVDALVDLKGLAFEWPARHLAISGLDLHLPVSTRSGIHGKLSADRVLYKRLKAKLGVTDIAVTPSSEDPNRFHVHLGGGKTEIPLTVSGASVKIGNIDGTIALRDEFSYDVKTAVHIDPVDVSAVTNGLCIQLSGLPPAKVGADFSEIQLTPGTIDPTGQVTADLFNGKIEISNIGVYDLNTEVPEFDFDMDLNGLRLDQIGDWSGFGEMDGILRAYAHDVVLQRWLPTQYDFTFQANHLSHSQVVFSPEAMRNVAKLVASNSIDSLPGIAKWLAFGWPSHLLGGYDIYFFGISLFSHQGGILLQVLDQPDLSPFLTDRDKNDILYNQKQNHYILYGRRFKIPLNSYRYPMVVDATTVSNYVHGVIENFANLAAAKKRKEAETHLNDEIKAVGNVKKAKEKIWNEENQKDCAPPTL